MTCGAQKTEEGKLPSICRQYEQYKTWIEFLAEQAVAHGLWAAYGEKLSALYMRLMQGPIRMAVVGETSAGKSTLINAFAGEFVAPENAGVCTPMPLWLMHHDNRTLYVNAYRREEGRLPVCRPVNRHRLLEQQYGAGAHAVFSHEDKHFVYVNSASLPRYVTLVDTPGLNAGDVDTRTTMRLFEKTAYGDGRTDAPEMVLYVTGHANLSQTEADALKALKSLGVEMENCFIVHNDFRHAFQVVPSCFEKTNDQAVSGLRQSLSALMQEERPADAWDFDSLFSAAQKPDSGERVFSVNAMLARLQCVSRDGGLYDVFDYLPQGMTQEERASWEALCGPDDTQHRLAGVRDKWVAQGNRGYAPMRELVEAIERHALRLAQTDERLTDALRAADLVGEALLKECKAHIVAHAPAVPNERVDLMRGLLKQTEENRRRFAEQNAIGACVKEIEKEALNAIRLHNGKVKIAKDSLSGVRIGVDDALIIVGGLGLGQFWLLILPLLSFLTSDSLPRQFKKLLRQHGIRDEALVRLCQTPERQVLLGLASVGAQMAASINEQLMIDRKKLQADLQKAVNGYVDSLKRADDAFSALESERLRLTGEPRGATECAVGSAEPVAKQVADQILALLPKLCLGSQEALADQLFAGLVALNQRGGVRPGNVRDKIYKGVMEPMLAQGIGRVTLDFSVPEMGTEKTLRDAFAAVGQRWTKLENDMEASLKRAQEEHAKQEAEQRERLKDELADFERRFRQKKGCEPAERET